MSSFILVLTILLNLCLSCCQSKPDVGTEVPGEPPVLGRQGMVSSAHPLATQAGLEILKQGGNAFDATVAVASVLNVVEPMMSGMGGYGTILICDAEHHKVRFLDSSGKIPTNVDSDVFRAPTPHYMENRHGPKAVSTPGNVNAWEAMSREYGNLEWSKLFAPAIHLAEQGFAITARTAQCVKQAFDSFPEHVKQFYGKQGVPLQKGDVLIQKDLARSFRLVAEQGAVVFYKGEIGKAIDAEMKGTGGFLSLADLQADRAEWWNPISIDYRGYRVYTASPPSTAFPSLIRLGMMERFQQGALEHNSAAYLHCFAEVTKHAFWCRLAYAGDPEIKPPPLDKLLSDSYWEEEVRKIDPRRARPFHPPGIKGEEGVHTTHFVVADKKGNIVSATQTLGNIFGSRIMPEGTGIWLNNSLEYCTFEPKGNPMDAHAGHRKLSGDCPTIIFKGDKPCIAMGTPGGHTIGQTVPQMVMNIIDFQMDIQRAIAAPRISFIEPDIIAVEDNISDSVVQELAQMGHNVKVVKALGNAHGLSIEYDKKGNPVRFQGGSDPRGEGKAEGY